MTAWFSITPVMVASTFTRNTTVALELMAMVPPAVPFAPVPRRTFTVRVAGTYSPWSSPTLSVFEPLLGPAVTRIDPGTNESPTGSGSFRTTLVAVSLPVLVAEIVYSMVSPGSTAPPGCALMSVNVFVAPPKSGLYVEMEVTNPPNR